MKQVRVIAGRGRPPCRAAPRRLPRRASAAAAPAPAGPLRLAIARAGVTSEDEDGARNGRVETAGLLAGGWLHPLRRRPRGPGRAERRADVLQRVPLDLAARTCSKARGRRPASIHPAGLVACAPDRPARAGGEPASPALRRSARFSDCDEPLHPRRPRRRASRRRRCAGRSRSRPRPRRRAGRARAPAPGPRRRSRSRPGPGSARGRRRSAAPIAAGIDARAPVTPVTETK